MPNKQTATIEATNKQELSEFKKIIWSEPTIYNENASWTKSEEEKNIPEPENTILKPQELGETIRHSHIETSELNLCFAFRLGIILPKII